MDVKEEMIALAEKLKIYQDTYYKEGKSLVSDSEYDRLTDRLIALEKEFPDYAAPDSPTKRVGSDLTNDFPEVQHTIPVLSLDKAYSDESVLDFFSRSIEKKGGELSFAAEEKIDGISMVLYYEDGILVRAVTRGNGSVGNDVTPNIVTIPSIPLSLPEPLDIAVRGEVYLPKKEFEKVNATLPEDEKAANPRNLAAGTVRRQKSQEAARIPLDMYCYEGFWGDESATPKDHLHIMKKLSDLGFRINPDFAFFSRTKEEAEERLKEAGLEGDGYGFSDIKEYISRMTQKRPGLDHEIDGLVFKINELDVRQEFGYTEHHPRWAIAYKFESPQAETVLEGITIQVGRTGRITPVAETEPVSLGGSTIKRATLHNQEYIDSLELAIGDRVSITKRGDVIPAVEEVVEKNEVGNTTYKIPLFCPCCGTPLVHKGVHLFCPNYDCPDQALIKEAQMSVVYSDASRAAGLYVKSQSEAMKSAASNPNGAFAGFMGMGMAGGNADPSSLFRMAEEKKEKKDVWVCSCGKENTGKFCTECGSKKAESWVCSCGAVNTGKFCSECGKKRSEGVKCPTCGWTAPEGSSPKFCPECGSKL